MKKNLHTLSEADEILLEKYFDNEASFLERFSARRLISRDAAAQRYLSSLESTQAAVKEAVPLEGNSLWMRISARLHAEERSVVLLGKRNFEKEGSLFGWKPAGLLLRGGAAAALGMALIVSAMPHARQGQQNSGITTAARSVTIQRGVPLAVPASVGVDWMRSDGRLQVMHEPEERAPLIFVKRRFNRVGPVYRTERNSQGVVMKERGLPQSMSVNSER